MGSTTSRAGRGNASSKVEAVFAGDCSAGNGVGEDVKKDVFRGGRPRRLFGGVKVADGAELLGGERQETGAGTRMGLDGEAALGLLGRVGGDAKRLE